MIFGRTVRHVVALDLELMQRAGRWRPPRWVQVWMIAATRAGDRWLWWALAPPMMIFGGRAGLHAAGAEGLAGLAAALLYRLLKHLCRRERPAREERPAWSKMLPPDRFSFPSGHALTSFACAVPLSLFYPALLPLFLLTALSIAVSRVVLGMHFLSDVVAGSLMGCALGYAAYCLML